ncbi:polysaccharide biosynthesis tyrosine autokinase [Pseudoalteromonas sp. T1lg22]|uniref:polysaccharide biosynthesis tyrosine autokinase n=1 Tax=Pseudoalteromonas sp. T1lg22 TaxID=2077096 RepID=UPI001F462CD5|nr:polysaccharide biosynthesis tyrosine autokinase [Pseudoalteromonas sp. T1lg22]
MSNLKNQRIGQDRQQEQEIDLLALFAILLDRKYFIILITAIFTVIGVATAVFSKPIYKATALIQVEQSKPSVPGLEDMAGMFEGTSGAITEIELLKSRTVIGEAVDSLNLNLVAKPKLIPLIGDKFFRGFNPQSDTDLAEPFMGFDQYAWGGESIDVFRFDVPKGFLGQAFELVTTDNGYELYNPAGEQILVGQVGQDITQGYYKLSVRKLTARPGSTFILVKNDRYRAILGLQSQIRAIEKAKDSGIIELSFEHSSPAYAEKVLNKISSIYVRNNVDRNSAEAAKSLQFLEVQLPEIKKQLERAERKYNEHQRRYQSIDISLETQGLLDQVVELETKLQELELKRVDISRKFKKTHPTYQGVLGQIEAVSEQRDQLVAKVSDLPQTQQELLRLRRDVEVSNEIYMLLLGKTQELDIIRAGTVGNVRVVDQAAVDTTKPVKPKKALMVVLATFLGALIALVIVFIQKVMNRGVEDAGEIEALGIPVYASVPYSDLQNNLNKESKPRGKKEAEAGNLLALYNPADLTIESLRSLRTSLHFAMMEAKNKVLAISSPSPGAGKSFISGNLAVVLAQSGKKVLVVDADMRKGFMHKHFNVASENGLSDLLSGRIELNKAIQATEVEGLHFIARGMVPPNPSELLMHKNFDDFVAQVNEQYDFVIIDTPPILAVTDPAIVSAHAGTTLLVTRFGLNQVREIELTVNRFAQNGIDVKGVVFNGVVKKAGSAYGYYNYAYQSESA